MEAVWTEASADTTERNYLTTKTTGVVGERIEDMLRVRRRFILTSTSTAEQNRLGYHKHQQIRPSEAASKRTGTDIRLITSLTPYR